MPVVGNYLRSECHTYSHTCFKNTTTDKIYIKHNINIVRKTHPYQSKTKQTQTKSSLIRAMNLHNPHNKNTSCSQSITDQTICLHMHSGHKPRKIYIRKFRQALATVLTQHLFH